MLRGFNKEILQKMKKKLKLLEDSEKRFAEEISPIVRVAKSNGVRSNRNGFSNQSYISQNSSTGVKNDIYISSRREKNSEESDFKQILSQIEEEDRSLKEEQEAKDFQVQFHFEQTIEKI